MFICVSCGNALDFEVNVWAPVTVDAMTGPVSIAMEVDPRRYEFSCRCTNCSRSDIRNLRLITPRNLVNEIARATYRDVRCPVQATRLAKEWFLEHAPHFASWMADEIVGDVLVASEVFRRIPEAEVIVEEDMDETPLIDAE